MLITFSDLPEIRSRHNDQTIVLVGGCYDLLHVGHVAFLERCQLLGDILVVAVSSDLRIKERKGNNRPIIPEAERAVMTSSLRCVDYGLVAPDPDPNQPAPSVRMVQTLRPHIFATSDTRYHAYASDAAAYGTIVVHVEEIRLTSTTDIIERVRGL